MGRPPLPRCSECGRIWRRRDRHARRPRLRSRAKIGIAVVGVSLGVILLLVALISFQKWRDTTAAWWHFARFASMWAGPLVLAIVLAVLGTLAAPRRTRRVVWACWIANASILCWWVPVLAILFVFLFHISAALSMLEPAGVVIPLAALAVPALALLKWRTQFNREVRWYHSEPRSIAKAAFLLSAMAMGATVPAIVLFYVALWILR